MKNFLFPCLFFFFLYFLGACHSEGICSCGEACTVSANGTVSCSLSDAELEKRKVQFQNLFFSKAEKIDETDFGYSFVFKDQDKLNERLFDFILTEKKCCPFFQYDIVILPFNQGIQFKVSGDEEVKAFLDKLFSEFI